MPFMVLPLYAALERMDWSLVEAARDLYADGWTAFRKVTLPLSLPGVVAGSILVFIPSLGAYVTPALLGGAKTVLLGDYIVSQFLAARNWPFGSALSFGDHVRDARWPRSSTSGGDRERPVSAVAGIRPKSLGGAPARRQLLARVHLLLRPDPGAGDLLLQRQQQRRNLDQAVAALVPRDVPRRGRDACPVELGHRGRHLHHRLDGSGHDGWRCRWSATGSEGSGRTTGCSISRSSSPRSPWR